MSVFLLCIIRSYARFFYKKKLACLVLRPELTRFFTFVYSCIVPIQRNKEKQRNTHCTCLNFESLKQYRLSNKGERQWVREKKELSMFIGLQAKLSIYGRTKPKTARDIPLVARLKAQAFIPIRHA